MKFLFTAGPKPPARIPSQSLPASPANPSKPATTLETIPNPTKALEQVTGATTPLSATRHITSSLPDLTPLRSSDSIPVIKHAERVAILRENFGHDNMWAIRNTQDFLELLNITTPPLEIFKYVLVKLPTNELELRACGKGKEFGPCEHPQLVLNPQVDTFPEKFKKYTEQIVMAGTGRLRINNSSRPNTLSFFGNSLNFPGTKTSISLADAYLTNQGYRVVQNGGLNALEDFTSEYLNLEGFKILFF